MTWPPREGRSESSWAGYAVDTRHPATATLWLAYRVVGPDEDVRYPVRLTATRPRFGGVR
jgi:hypothetical protein